MITLFLYEDPLLWGVFTYRFLGVKSARGGGTMEGYPVQVYFVPEDLCSLWGCEGYVNPPVVDDYYFVFGHCIVGYLRGLGVARWNLKTGRCDFVEIPDIITSVGGQRRFVCRMHWLYPHWNCNFPDRLLLSLKAVLRYEKSGVYFTFYCYMLVDFETKQSSAIIMSNWTTQMTLSDSDLRRFIENLFYPDYLPNVRIHLHPPVSIRFITYNPFHHYFDGNRFHIYEVSGSPTCRLWKFTLDFSDKSLESCDLGSVPHRDLLCLVYDRLVVLYSVEGRYTDLFFDDKPIFVRRWKPVGDAVNCFGVSYESETFYFISKRFGSFDVVVDSELYEIHKEVIYKDPEHFVMNMVPSDIVLPIKESFRNNKKVFYCLSSKYWFHNYNKWSCFSGKIPDLSEPADLW